VNEAVPANQPVVLFVEGDILVRTAMAAYIRECGYAVIEAASSDEAISLLRGDPAGIDIVFADVEIPGSVDGFGLSRWIREHRVDVRLILAGTLQKAAQLAGDLCEEGPHLRKPYEPSALVDWIKRLRARN
jgi:DNA-binding response OmpR family regulator